MLYGLARVLRYPRFLMAPPRFAGEPNPMNYVSFVSARREQKLFPSNPLFAAPIRDVDDIIVVRKLRLSREADVIAHYQPKNLPHKDYHTLLSTKDQEFL